MPRELVTRALHRAALDGADFAPRRFAAALVPSLRLDLGVARSQAPMQSRWAVEVLARLSWPLDAIAAGDARALVGPSMRRAARRDRVLEDLGEKWRVAEERRRVFERRHDVNAQLDLEEAEAELDAVAGEERP
ncbi:MAG TPA: hypothetical protein VFF06_10765 [Polyangia bacterium]|nr:hypothetical protein [Polyangia bacterium]